MPFHELTADAGSSTSTSGVLWHELCWYIGRPENVMVCRGMHDRRHQELTGNNVINPGSYSGLGERAISTAKHNALYKSNVFSHESNSPKAQAPPPQVV